MRRASALLALAAACSSPAPAPPPLPAPAPARERDREIIALYNGEPLYRRDVADKALELDVKHAVDQYVRWRILEDRKAKLGIDHTPEELRRRAETFVRRVRERMEEKAFREQLGREGLTEESYVLRIQASRFLSETLVLEKIVRFQSLSEERVEIDRVVFRVGAEAAAFHRRAREGGFDAALAALGGDPSKGAHHHETFSRGLPREDLDETTIQALFEARPGDLLDPVVTRLTLWCVIRVAARHAARQVRYQDVKGEILEGILREPPPPEELKRWLDRELSRSRIEYRAGRAP